MNPKSSILLHLDFIFYGILGLLARLGTELLGAYQGPLNGVLWSNFIGCVWMGFVAKLTFILQPLNLPISTNNVDNDKNFNDQNKYSSHNVNSSSSQSNDNNINQDLTTSPDLDPEPFDYVSKNYPESNDNNQSDVSLQTIDIQTDEVPVSNTANANPETTTPSEPLDSISQSFLQRQRNQQNGTSGRTNDIQLGHPKSNNTSPSHHFPTTLRGHNENANLRRRKFNLFKNPINNTTSHHSAHQIVKGNTPIYIALTTGFAGSFTTFSSFILETFNFSANIQPSVSKPHNISALTESGAKLENISKFPYPDPGWGAPMAFAYIICTMALSVGGYVFGRHLADFVEHGFSSAASKEDYKTYKHKSWLVRKLKTGFFEGLEYKWWRRLEYISALLGVLTYLLLIALIVVSNISTITNDPSVNITHRWRYWILSMMFTPAAVYLRYWVIKIFNPRVFKGRFPFGTFLCNMFATFLLAFLNMLQRGGNIAGNKNRIIAGHIECDVIKALEDGFCGSLSTISTFVNEMYNLDTFDAYVYGVVSVILGYAGMVLIFGTYIWTNGINDVCY